MTPMGCRNSRARRAFAWRGSAATMAFMHSRLADVDIPLPPLPATLAALVERGIRVRYPKNVVLIQEGDVDDVLFIILRGQVRVFSSGPRGNELTLGIYGPGEYIGEMSLDGSPRSASVITQAPTECARVTGRALRLHIAEHPDFAFELLAKVIRRARAATLSATHIALNDVYGRLAELLRTLARPAEGHSVIDQRPTHQEIANRLGCSREMVSRLMKDLQRGGYVVKSGAALQVQRELPPRW